MASSSADLPWQVCRAARRLNRLFRIERAGGFARRREDVVARLLRRRHALVDEFLRLETERRARSATLPRELRDAVNDLAQEVERSRRKTEDRVERLRAELRLLRGEGTPTGLRGSMGGRVIGRG
ncbi:MAG TPA: hypothetical protein VN832_11450 [Stellaceae bacterium]|nr:hypothetical protein [Stellaceae bacterium]